MLQVSVSPASLTTSKYRGRSSTTQCLKEPLYMSFYLDSVGAPKSGALVC
jgi:hypothetical protein